eukprot:4732790-Amphidinium_carterae.1
MLQLDAQVHHCREQLNQHEPASCGSVLTLTGDCKGSENCEHQLAAGLRLCLYEEQLHWTVVPPIKELVKSVPRVLAALLFIL